MGNLSRFSSGLAHEMVISANAVGFKPSEFDELLRNRTLLSQVLEVVRGTATISPIISPIIEKLVPYDRFPVIPREKEGWGVLEHNTGKKCVWRGDLITLTDGRFPSSSDEKKTIAEIRSEVGGWLLPSTVLDFFLEHENRSDMPEEWIGKNIFFLGTVFFDPSDGCRYVTCMKWLNGRHYRDYFKLDDMWSQNDYAVTYYYRGW